VTVSYLELYNEDLIDLLATDDRQLKMCWNDDRKGVEIPGLEEIRVTSPEDIFHVLERSAHKRQTAATLLNKHSSYDLPSLPPPSAHAASNCANSSHSNMNSPMMQTVPAVGRTRSLRSSSKCASRLPMERTSFVRAA